MEFIDQPIDSSYWNKETVIAELLLSNTSKLRVSIGELDKTTKICLRKFVVKDDNLIATKKGVNIDMSVIDELIESLEYIKNHYPYVGK